jgi:hypothetical protein
MADTNQPVSGTASTTEHLVGTGVGAIIGWTLGTGLAATASVLSGGLLAPVAVAVTPGIAAVIGGYIGHKATAPTPTPGV